MLPSPLEGESASGNLAGGCREKPATSDATDPLTWVRQEIHGVAKHAVAIWRTIDGVESEEEMNQMG